MSHDFSGPLISKLRGGLGRRNPTTDSVFGLVVGGVAVAGLLALGQIVKLIQPADAETVGINAAYDANNSVKVYHHIQRYFHYNPDGTLYLKVVAQATTLTAICGPVGDLRQLLTSDTTNGEIRKVGVALNVVAAPVAGDFTTGLLTDVLTAIPQAQALVDALASEAMYVDNVMLSGIISATAGMGTLPSLRALASESVSVCIARDPDVISTVPYAEIGSALGMLSVRKVSECLGSVDVARKPEASKGTETYPLTNTAKGYFLTAALSNGTGFGVLSDADKTALKTKGYIYAGRFQGFDGVYFNDSPTCTEAASDYAYIEDSGVWCKAVRYLRKALLPVFKGEVEVDTTTGFMTPGTTAYYKAKGEKGVGVMATDGEISGKPTVSIEPNQDVVGTSTVKMALTYRRQGILRSLEATVGADNPAAS